ncbi:MAG: NUDIX domain-containing protein [Bacteroidetes bacterium]|nr:NUDIX domain-containing protein [Bacteroidota bacterium]
MESGKRIITRVYGFIIHKDEILISEEYHYNSFMRKFPGGGMEEGEVPESCLKRELKEELDLDLMIEDCIYITPQPFTSVFNNALLVKCLYFKVQAIPEMLTLYREEYELPSSNGEEKFKWVKLSTFEKNEFTFKTDQEAFEFLKTQYYNLPGF